jgi:poly-gamma-glutamate synthesis protein (capsule biosynthesis protein)
MRIAGLLSVMALLAACATAAPSLTPTSTSTLGPRSTGGTTATPDMSPMPQPTPQPVAILPVVGFWSTTAGISRAELDAALAGSSTTYRRVLVAGTWPGAAPATTEQIRAAVNADPRTIGLLPATAVTPDVHALALDGLDLFGNGRLRSLADWPLMMPESSLDALPAFDASATWTLVAGGDVMLDRTPYVRMVRQGGGADFAWNGGYAQITSYACCNEMGNRLPVARRTGGAGVVRALFSDADLAVVNLEGPAIDDFTYHADGFVFTMDPALLQGLADAGIDAVTVANNHIGNAGPSGIVETLRHLEEVGLAHVGAGANLAAATAPAWFDVAGRRVALLGYDAIRPGYHATATRPGSAGLDAARYGADIAAARSDGADVVVVLPHWGVEYTAAPSVAERADARGLVAAGADLVLGSHSHWAGAAEWIEGHPVFYSMGDLVFALRQSTETLEGLVVEATFAGDRLVQVRLHATLILELVQPNLLDPAGDGAAVIDRMRRASSVLADH